VKIFGNSTISYGYLTKDIFNINMDCTYSTASCPATTKLIFDPFGQSLRITSGDFSEGNRIIFPFMEESSSMANQII
jgi:hypothetical protein